MQVARRIWILIDSLKCTGCRLCEIACSLKHEGSIWPSASRIQVFEPYPGAPVPITCVQCNDYPCVKSCAFEALHVNDSTGAIIVEPEKCTMCGACKNACPLSIPRIIPGKSHVLICDLCGGDPECVKACDNAGYHALKVDNKPDDFVVKTFLKNPYETSREIFERIVLGDR